MLVVSFAGQHARFFCGPAFAGAVALPRSLLQEVEADAVYSSSSDSCCGVPEGIGGFLTEHEIPGYAVGGTLDINTDHNGKL
jgi:hypothetical protein